MKQTIINTLKGVAIGDAFGVGIEFKSRFWIRENVNFDKWINVWGEGKNNILPGTYSGGTEHTIALTEALISKKPFSIDLLLKKFKNEHETDKAQKGSSRNGYGKIKEWYDGNKTIDEVRKAQASHSDPGNEPVVRALPLAFIKNSDVGQYSKINADVTHPNEIGRKASYLTILIAWHFLRENGDAGGLMNFLEAFIGDEETEHALEKIDALPKPSKLSESDYVILHGEQPSPYISLPYFAWDSDIYGLPCAAMKTALNAVYVLKHSNSAIEALQNSINMGGDVDSLAAVCTGIAAGKYGLDSLPQFLLDQTEGLGRIEILGEKLYEKFSAIYS